MIGGARVLWAVGSFRAWPKKYFVTIHSQASEDPKKLYDLSWFVLLSGFFRRKKITETDLIGCLCRD